MNIALIKQYHENMPKRQARRLALTSLERFGLGAIAPRRNTALSTEERFYVMLLRAAMVNDAMILIDQPFQMVPHLKDSGFILNALKIIDDLYASCHIFDYRWMQDKYGEL